MPACKSPITPIKTPLKWGSTVLFSAFLTACSGGGSSSSSANTSQGGGSSTGSTIEWTAGTFADKSNFDNQCQSPRSGTNPATGSAYLDAAGSTLHENHFLRSWSDDTYLWYNEITDRNPALYNDPLDYFDLLRTNATTASGALVDKFHFTYDTAVYYQLSSSGASAGYGARFSLIRSIAPRDIRIAYIQPGSPADAAGLKRGDTVISINGEDAINGTSEATVDALNAGLFPDAAGQDVEFVFQDAETGQNKTISLTSGIITSDPVLLSKTITTETAEKVGYLVFNTFGNVIAEQALVDTFTQFESENVDDLIIDLRYNGGGYLAISSQLAYMIAGAVATDDRIFETVSFNDKHPVINPVTGAAITPAPFYSETLGFSDLPAGQALPSVDLERVFILTTGRTCSASEALINGLGGIDVEVILIGETTCGKPYGFYGTDNCGTTYFTIQLKGVNNKGFGDYSDGFSPNDGNSPSGEPVIGCTVADDYANELGNTAEAQLSAALSYQAIGVCPPADAALLAKANIGVFTSDPASDLLNDPRIARRMHLEQSRLTNLPTRR